MRAVTGAGLQSKAVTNGCVALSTLNSSKKTNALGFLDKPLDDVDPFVALFDLACDFRESGSKIANTITSTYPLPGAYVRKSYYALYGHIQI